MAARWLDIARKQRRSLGFHASIADFAPGDAEAASPETILRNHDLSLYCLDNTCREAIFVLLPASIDLTAAAFVYKQQYDEALRLFALPYADFLRLAAALPAVDRFIMAYMTGRSGIDAAHPCLQPAGRRREPLRAGRPRRARPAAARRGAPAGGNATPCWTRCCGSSSARPTTVCRPVCALKMRSESMQLAGLIQATYPQARNLFLYRDAVGWVGSMYRIFMRLGAVRGHHAARRPGRFRTGALSRYRSPFDVSGQSRRGTRAGRVPCALVARHHRAVSRGGRIGGCPSPRCASQISAAARRPRSARFSTLAASGKPERGRRQPFWTPMRKPARLSPARSKAKRTCGCLASSAPRSRRSSPATRRSGTPR